MHRMPTDPTHPAKPARPLRRLERGDVEPAWSGLPSRTGVFRRLRAIRRGVGALAWTLFSLLVQAALIWLPGRAKVRFARLYWRVMCRLIGINVRVIGGVPASARPVVFVSNHSSWLDILVLGGRLDACFISKDAVEGWPIVNLVARLGRTVYVRRQRASTGRERDDMRTRLAAGDNLILFPEGTTSDGSRVMPFRSTFLSAVEAPVTADGRHALVQPVSVVYDRIGGLPIGRASRPVFAWYGDMDLASHFWRLAQNRGLRATVLLHARSTPPTSPAARNCPRRHGTRRPRAPPHCARIARRTPPPRPPMTISPPPLPHSLDTHTGFAPTLRHQVGARQRHCALTRPLLRTISRRVAPGMPRA